MIFIRLFVRISLEVIAAIPLQLNFNFSSYSKYMSIKTIFYSSILTNEYTH